MNESDGNESVTGGNEFGTTPEDFDIPLKKSKIVVALAGRVRADKVSHTELARMTGMRRPTITRILTTETANITSLEKLTDAMGLTDAIIHAIRNAS